MRAGWSSVVGMVALFAATPAHAQSSPAVRRIGGRAVLLEWQVPPECPAREYVLERTARLVGNVSESGNSPELGVHATVEKLPSGSWQLLFDSSQGAAAARQMQGRSCAEMAEATALLLAWLIDPSLPARPAPDPVDVQAKPEPAEPQSESDSRAEPKSLESNAPSQRKSTTSLPEREASRRKPSARRFVAPTFEAAVEFSVWLNRLPQVVPGVQLSAGARFTRLRLL
ncbi:MAG TPA: hypothetical protein VMF89_07090, partial [Polyangiales bacterium]|nr:hypothetical protein [Polyangiales bacterium]